MIYQGDCLKVLENIEKVDLIITSPPYFNAREYSQYSSFDEYMNIMKDIFSLTYEKTTNHRYCVINVGDVNCSIPNHPKLNKKFPLGAYFTVMMEEIGWEFVDDYIWDKGEPQSKRHLGNPPYPFYQYPVNCYEHILVFVKHEIDKTRLRCPVCNSDKVVSNSLSNIGVQSWECKNPECPAQSEGGRGKRFSARSIMMNDYKTEENKIPEWFIREFRRDIVKINPVIKINSDGENKLGHTAPFPNRIPELAIRYFSGVGDIVLDMFMGSGTTGIVCKDLDREFIGIELNEEYFSIYKRRIEEHKKDCRRMLI